MNISELQTFDFISNLPSEVSLNILSYLTPQELAKSKSVSKNWLELSSDHALWRPFFSSIPGKIENLEQAKEYCKFHKKAKSKEELITKIRNFFEDFKNHREVVIGMHYQSASSPQVSWYYFQCFAPNPHLESLGKPKQYFNSIHLKLHVIGSDEADFSEILQDSFFHSGFSYRHITFVAKLCALIPFYSQPVIYGIAEYLENCDIHLTNEVAKKSGLRL